MTTRSPNNKAPVIRPQKPSYAGARGMSRREQYDHIQAFQKVQPLTTKANNGVGAAGSSGATAAPPAGGGGSAPSGTPLSNQTPYPVAVGTTANAGLSSLSSRADHTHDLLVMGPAGFIAWTATTGTYTATLSGILPLANGGTGANLAATGGAGQYVKQSGSGAVFTVGTIAAGDLPIATTGAFGAVKPDGTTITITAGVISAPPQTPVEVATTTKTANYSLVAGNVLVPFDCTTGALIATLPAATSYNSSHLGIIKIDVTANSLTLVPTGTDTINGLVAKVTMTQFGGFLVTRNAAGNGWYIMGVF